MFHLQKYLGEALVASLFCLVTLGVASSASAVPPVNVPFNDPVKTWPSEYWDVTELPAAWATTLGSPSVKIAVIDSGIKPIDDLAVNLVLPGHNSWNGSKKTSDEDGHGTMVASVIAATANNSIGVIGVCPRCKIIPVRASSPPYRAGKPKRQYWDVTSDSLARGIKWAANHGAKVINVSFSPAKGDSSSTFDKAVSYAISKGSTVVISAGNGTDNNDKGTSNPEANSFAADNPGAIRVASADAWNSLAYLSNYGPRLADVAAFGEEVPVDSIDINVPTGVSGTTVSAAVVSGIAGLLLSVHPELTPAQVKAIIMSSCSHPDKKLRVPCGGVVSAKRALTAAQNPPKSISLRIKVHDRGRVYVGSHITCKRNCRYDLVAGKLTIVAVADRNWHFVRWTGGISSKKAKLSINMKAAKSIKAVFVKNKVKRR